MPTLPTLPTLPAPADLGRRLAMFCLGALGVMSTRSAFAATEQRVLRALERLTKPCHRQTAVVRLSMREKK